MSYTLFEELEKRAQAFAETHVGKRIRVIDKNDVESKGKDYEAIVVGYHLDIVAVRLLNGGGHDCSGTISLIKGYEHLFVKGEMYWLLINRKGVKVKILTTLKNEIAELIKKLEL